MAEDNLAADAALPNQNVVNVDELKTLFSNPKADIPIFMETAQRTQ